MVMWDWPRDRPVIYQIFVCLSVWSWYVYHIPQCVALELIPIPRRTFFNLFSIYFCGFYIKGLDPQPYHPTITCGNKDFLGTLLLVSIYRWFETLAS
jgi:osomolarity two-component system sensor histidine kinase SLN1